MNSALARTLRERQQLMDYIVELVTYYEKLGTLDVLNLENIMYQIIHEPEFKDMDPTIVEIVLKGWGIK